MYDKFNRKINYLRISITDRCNLRCKYCMPAEGIKHINHKDILTFEEIIEVVKVGVKLGIDKVRITGGEPLVRKGIVDFIKMLSAVEGIKDLAMTTNGVYLDKYALKLSKAGLMRVNISLDTLDENKFKELTRGGDVNDVLKGIVAAQNAGLKPIKINCVVNNNSEEKDAKAVAEFCKQNGLNVRFIHLMDLHYGEFSVVEGGDGGNCGICNRLRLTANGKIMPCLFSDIEYDVRNLGIEKAFISAIKNKPKCGTKSKSHEFYNIGG